MEIDPKRRITVTRMSAPEVEIYLARRAVECLPPHKNLTLAGLKLEEAATLVADYIDTAEEGLTYADHLSAPLDPKTIGLYKSALALCDVYVEPYVVELALKIFNAVQIFGNQFTLKDAAEIGALVKKIHGGAIHNRALYEDVKSALKSHFDKTPVSEE